jgi:arabinose-5-phosphate isomerase
VSSNQEILNAVQTVLSTEAQALKACAERIHREPMATQIVKAITTMQECLDAQGKIVITGMGKSGKIAQKIAATLSSTGSLSVYLHPSEGLHGDLGILQSKDIVWALSYSGNTEEIIRLLPSFQKLGVKLIGMGGNSQSKLARESAIWIDASVEQEACPHNLAPTTSTTLALAIGDAIAVCLMKIRKFDTEAFAKNHPAGSIGKKINLKVSDLMHHLQNVSVVSENAPVDEVLVSASEKKLGGVLVTRNSKLLGLITDGDIRRALKHREKIFSLKASEIMTHNPITVDSEESAFAALRIMEDRESQIHVLPVVDAKFNVVGLLRLHDIARTL